MGEVSARDLTGMFEAVAAAIDREKDRLSELDGVIGDADHGVTMDIGLKAVVKALSAEGAAADPMTVFSTAAKSFLNAVGASSGPLYATAFLRAAAVAKGRETLDAEAMTEIVAAMAEGIRHRGKGERGEKTMLDAWLPAAEAGRAARAGGQGLAASLAAAATAAEEGAEATKDMLAARGRASRLGERAIGHIDPGAASAALILRTIADHFAGRD
ncbi:dihydroxyacetone kinase subunit L [Aureimonas endophytica]|uniref:Dihydroxyacetone kinase subunit L n=1 Tax=Aureimonas endophytica TaxID=2027858 RepID=A0A916ZH41_9HYPH|nr:dihydroxyacetone kinase subunit DhaL [Aureimonas endophytica]GGD98081.1 dihydroxyacetone kinase subunit L [Aureimonas endophytica]